MREALKEAKRYLNTDFKAHVGRDENSSNHCIVYALSDPSDPNLSGECQHWHDARCDRCECLDVALEKIAQKLDEVDITEDQRARIKFQKKECARAILAWKAHLVRSVAQEEAKQDALVQLDQEK